MDGILTVVRACPETQLDYSNYFKDKTSLQSILEMSKFERLESP
jgi:hypothetical protein